MTSGCTGCGVAGASVAATTRVAAKESQGDRMNAASAINGAVFFRSFMAKVAKMDSAVGPQHWRQLSPFPVCALRRFDLARGLFSRLLCLRCALSRARREGAVLHGMDDPHPLMPRPPSLARSKRGSKISWPRKPEREVSFLAALVKFSFTDLLEDWSAACIGWGTGARRERWRGRL